MSVRDQLLSILDPIQADAMLAAAQCANYKEAAQRIGQMSGKKCSERKIQRLIGMANDRIVACGLHPVDFRHFRP